MSSLTSTSATRSLFGETASGAHLCGHRCRTAECPRHPNAATRVRPRIPRLAIASQSLRPPTARSIAERPHKKCAFRTIADLHSRYSEDKSPALRTPGIATKWQQRQPSKRKPCSDSAASRRPVSRAIGSI